MRPDWDVPENLHDPVSENDFLKLVSSVFDAGGIRYSKPDREIRLKKLPSAEVQVPHCLMRLLHSGADAFVTADIKYHNFFDAENKILLVDTGHFESEKFSTEILNDLIIKKFPKFAVRFSETNTNPINYL